jgi:hypothetical protein
LRKGPRGGGRDRDAVAEHVRESERSYGRSLGVRVPPRTPWPEQRAALSAAVRAGVSGTSWPARYGVRRDRLARARPRLGDRGPVRPVSRISSTDREILRLAVPAFGALVAEPLFLLTDSAIVGRLGTAPLAGLGSAGALLTSAVGLFVFLAYGTTAAVARRLGAVTCGAR